MVVDEIRPQVSGVRRTTPAAWAGERRAVEVDSAGYFQAGFIWVASCPLISDTLKKVGTQARIEMEDFFQKKVFLSLYVKVDADWRENKKELKRFGYEY